MLIVFCIEPVGTATACAIKVIRNKAMITVINPCSKNSRMGDFGGPNC